MLYQTFSYKIKELNVLQDEDSGVWYVNPDWVDATYRAGLGYLEDLEDSYITDWLDVKDILELEAARRNAKDDKKKQVIDWLYDVISAQVQPVMLQEETEYFKNLVEYMKVAHKEQDNGQIDSVSSAESNVTEKA